MLLGDLMMIKIVLVLPGTYYLLRMNITCYLHHVLHITITIANCKVCCTYANNNQYSIHHVRDNKKVKNKERTFCDQLYGTWYHRLWTLDHTGGINNANS